ncbi:hypothetical protein [Rathayibacter rathayi]|nr:hypothetical protein [Rathayibacter rathayi]
MNKAGEIANALVPLRQTYSQTRPFTGAVIAGEWTEPGIQHLKSQGIAVLYVPFAEIVDAFARYGIDMNLGEAAPLDYLSEQISKWDALGPSGQMALALTLVQQRPGRYAAFRAKIDDHLQRRIVRVRVLPLHGAALAFEGTLDAISALQVYPTTGGTEEPLDRIEVQLEFSNGDRIAADFRMATDAIAFLENQA